MKNIFKTLAIALTMSGTVAMAQQPAIQNFRAYDRTGINQFEMLKDNTTKYDGFKLRIGGAFTQQFQALSHENAADQSLTTIGGTKYDRNMLYPITSGFNTASANLMFDAQLEDGINLNLTTYLSSRHHNETWVKGGFLQIDRAKFLNSELVNSIFEYVTLKLGHQEINYGDAHFRRSDGGNTIYNPFIENYLIDAFTTEIGGEVYFTTSGFTAMLGATNGEIKGNVDPVARTRSAADSMAIYSDEARSMAMLWKLAYDNKIDKDLRVRASVSGYMKGKNGRATIFSGDRTGSNYFLVMESVAANPATTADPKPVATSQFTSGRVNANISDEVNAMAINLLAEGYGFELFFNYDMNTGRNAGETIERSFAQLAVDGIYRFGKTAYVGARYNTVTGAFTTGSEAETTVDRIAVAGGWFVTDNILLKGEYVMQSYKDYPTSSLFHEGKFNGVVVQAVVGF